MKRYYIWILKISTHTICGVGRVGQPGGREGAETMGWRQKKINDFFSTASRSTNLIIRPRDNGDSIHYFRDAMFDREYHRKPARAGKQNDKGRCSAPFRGG